MTEFLKGYAAGANDMEAGRLVTKASFTDEDVERVAEALYVLWQGAAPDWPEADNETVEEAREAAHAALSAYLEPTTKGDT